MIPRPAEFRIGDLVVYLKDPHHRAARSLYVYLGEANPDRRGQQQVSIQAVSRRAMWGSGIKTDRPIDVSASDVVPLAEFGMCVARLAAPGEAGLLCWQLWLRRDEELTPMPGRIFGRQIGREWDWMGWTMIDDDKLGELIRSAAREVLEETAT